MYNNDINSTLTVEQKFAKIMLHLRMLRPFYSAVYEVIEKRESDLVPTVGVGTNELVYNYEFINKTSFDELIFIMLHEVGHIALQHVARRENRDPELWNIACDFYINKVLSDEFSLLPGQTTAVEGIDISMPRSGLFCSTIDTDVDYTEKIYEELYEQAKRNGYNTNSMINELSGDEDGNGSSGSFSFTYQGSGKDSDLDIDGKSKYGKVTFDISRLNINDLIDNGDDQDIKNQKSEKIVTDAAVRVEMNSQHYGNNAGGLYAIVNKMRKSELDWRKLLRKYLITASSKDSSFLKPDKRMYYQKAIYPGQQTEEVYQLKGVKVCIDTSGSISDSDIEYFCGQVYDLTRKFQVDAELIYWDTSVESTGEFTGYKEFERIDIVGRGGTDPKVVFDYFDSKKCKVKPIVTLMFTDAYFSTSGINQRQRKKYKDTIWIMTRNHDKSFEPPFGKKALAKFS